MEEIKKTKYGRKSRDELEAELKKYKEGSSSSYSSSASRKRANKYASIDEELDEAIKNINWERRNEAEKDINKWIETYCLGVLLDDLPSPKCQQIIEEMFNASSSSTPVQLILPRGCGKTSFVECLVSYLMATGKKKFSVIISQNATSATNILSDIHRFLTDDETTFSKDYPTVAFPFIKNGANTRRKQTYNGKDCSISKTSTRMLFARLEDKEGKPFPTSEALIECRGISGGMRGLKHGTQRPDLIILDDVQDDECAESAERISKLLNTINKNILNLGGKNKVSVISTATPISEDDLVAQLENDKAWITKKYPAIINYPNEWEKEKHGLWGKYFELYDEEIAKETNHEKSLHYYKENQKEMDAGNIVINPNRFSINDGTISGIQFLLDKQHQIGDNAFSCEYQMKPKQISLEVKLKPKDVLSHIGNHFEDEIPDECQLTVCSIDLNTSYGATSIVVSFKPDSSAYVIKHKIFKLDIDQQLPQIQYDQVLFERLSRIVETIKSWNIQLDCLVIDCGGKNWNSVLTFSKSCFHNFGIPCCGLAGRSSLLFNPLAKNRLKNAISRTVLCGDEAEKLKKGNGKKWMYFDSDYYREQAQKSFCLANGNIGSTSLYMLGDHTDFAVQICNETLLWKKTTSKGTEYNWKSKEPHDYLDCLAMSFAVRDDQNINSASLLDTKNQPSKKALLLQKLLKNRHKIKIV